MFLDIQGLTIYYETSGQGEPVVLLHGWGGEVASFKPLFDYLAQRFQVYAFDFPGFGQSSLPPGDWGMTDYTTLVSHFFEKLGITKATLIGHSFGGRVALMLAANHPELVERLVLVDSAGVRPKRTITYYLKVSLAKVAKAVLSPRIWGERSEKMKDLFYGWIGAKDYRNAGSLRGTFVKVVNEDLRYLFPKIQAPTLLIWGERDEVTPLRDAKIMEAMIPDAGLVILPDAGHFSYLDQFPRFCRVISAFLEGS